MNKRYVCMGAVTLTALATLIAITLLITPTSAAQPSPSLAPLVEDDTPPLPTNYLIALPISLPNPDEIPSGLTPDQAAEYARSLTYRQARPILAELERLRAEGSIAGFEVQPNLHGVVVEGGKPEALERLSHLQGVAAVLPHKDEPPACAAAAAKALPEQVLGLSRITTGVAPRLWTASLAPQATDPSIDVHAPPGSTWTYVRGQTTFTSTTVTMRILRGGQVIATASTWSSSSGYYYFYPYWQHCPIYGYSWTLQPGDVVEVTAHGNTVSTVVANLSVWVDPDADTVAGQTNPGRSVETRLYDYGSDPCSSTTYSQTVSTDGSGNFSANFSSQVDFDRRAYAYVYARDANGNSTYASFDAYRIRAPFDDDYFSGYLKPEVAFNATLSRGGSTVSTYSGKSSASGYYSGWFTDTIQSGDVVQVSGGGVNVQYTATGLDVTLNHVTDQATGATGANRLVKAEFYKRAWWWYWHEPSGRWYPYLTTACSWDSDCNVTVADGSGAFVLTTTLDLARGDYADVYVYDGEGNYQYTYERPVPAIVADLTENDIRGFWSDPSTGYVTVTLKHSDGTMKEKDTGVWVDSWDGEFSTSMWHTITPTDIIEVTDGTVTETMTVQNLTARLDGGTGHLSGSAYSGHLSARLEDLRREYGGYWFGSWDPYVSYCAETDVTGGAYDLAFSGAQVGGQDDVFVWSTGPDNHYTYRHIYAFTINAEKGDDYVDGYSETPNVPVTVTLQRGGSPIAVYTTTSDSDDGYYYGELSNGTSVTITQGDTVTVQTGDGDSVSLPIPELTANTDGANNRIYGKSPADEPVRAEARRHYSHYGSYYAASQVTTADASGDYSASFDGLYWEDYDCSDVDAGHRCIQPVVYYYNSAGHQVWQEGPFPSPVGLDVYESDDISTTASAYAGIQSHTFHTVTDTDWVTFTVPAMDITTPVSYRIETFNLGWGMATRLDLYDTDGTTLLDSWTGYEYHGRGISVLWTPLAAGTYYLEVSPPYSSYAAYCDAAYDLMILSVRARVFLPLVMRNY